MRELIFLIATAMVVPVLHAQDDYDDIYYNPKNDKQESAKTSKAVKSQNNYIEDFGSIDVDDYNRRSDFYYTTAVDTIGRQTENAEDFVYTQQIQKFYNPTIVVDNSDVLADVLEDSYGNVNIVLDSGYPTFTSIYTGGYAWTPCYYNWCLTPSWTWSYGWGPFYSSWTWGPSWAWGPSWSYYDPYWGWGPSWSWGWGPSWGYYPPRPGWGPTPPPHRPSYAWHRPNPGATHPTSAGSGWASNTRPGGVYNGGTGRYGSTRRPSTSASGTRPSGSSGSTGTARPGHRNPNGGNSGNRGSNVTISGTDRWNISDRYKEADRVATERRIDGVTTNKRSSVSNGSTTNNRSYGTGRTSNGTGRGHSTGITTTNRSYNTTTNNTRSSYNTTTTNNSSRRSYNTTTNSNRSSGSSYRSGGGSRSNGGGGGHRSGGGGTGRGRR